MSQRDRLDGWAILILIVCCLVWGLNQSAIKIANVGISPLLQAGIRSILAGALLAIWMRLRGIRMFARDGTLKWGLLIGLLFAGEFVFLYPGLQMTSASRAVIFLYSSPFIVAIGSHLFVPGDRLTLTKAIGLIAAFCGVALAISDRVGGPATAAGDATTGLIGDLLCFVGALLWGAVTVIIRATPLGRIAAEKILLYQHAVAAVLLPPLSWLMGEAGITDLSTPVLGAFAYTVVLVAFISYTVWFWLIRTYPPSQVSAFAFLTPIFGVAGGALVLGETLTWRLTAALALVAAGLWLISRSSAPMVKAASKAAST